MTGLHHAHPCITLTVTTSATTVHIQLHVVLYATKLMTMVWVSLPAHHDQTLVAEMFPQDCRNLSLARPGFGLGAPQHGCLVRGPSQALLACLVAWCLPVHQGHELFVCKQLCQCHITQANRLSLIWLEHVSMQSRMAVQA